MPAMPIMKRVSNILKYGLGPAAKRKKQADKALKRKQRFDESGQWEHGADLVKRRYGSYEAYVAHQASKLDQVIGRLRENEEEDFVEFKRRFETCAALAPARTVLCLGARLGTEVRALHALGRFAVGIDLNPGADNPYVLPGDFHHVVFPDGSVDAVYTNTLDHVFDLERLMGEVRRLLRPGGLFVCDLSLGLDENTVPGEFEAVYWRDSDRMIETVRALGELELVEARDLGRRRRDLWRQAVLRKPVPVTERAIEGTLAS
jgi:SAM-dependent methyltransferase